MQWTKLGNIFDPTTLSEWPYTFGAVPYVGEQNGSLIKIYFTSRNEHSKSLITWGIFDFDNDFQLVELCDTPLLGLGQAGTFDEDGTMGCQITRIKGKDYLYYQGWNLASSVPFRNSIGLAVFEGPNQLRRISSGPIVDRGIYDPCFVATPHVIELPDHTFLMYYLSCDEWVPQENRLLHKYNIKIATSTDGIHWDRKGQVAIDYQSKFEYAFSVPRVIQEEGKFKMWYSYRGQAHQPTYRMGYAESADGLNWQRMDEQVGIDVSASGWDSEMICYPYILDYNGDRFMLYNGNEYGKTGFGIAKLENNASVP